MPRHLLAQLHTLKDVRVEAESKRFLVAANYTSKAKGYREVFLVRRLERAREVREASSAVVPIGSLLGTLANRLTNFASF